MRRKATAKPLRAAELGTRVARRHDQPLSRSRSAACVLIGDRSAHDKLAHVLGRAGLDTWWHIDRERPASAPTGPRRPRLRLIP
jgi:hypothetical protein